jgi:Mrp family chromosome partitioning ATPase
MGHYRQTTEIPLSYASPPLPSHQESAYVPYVRSVRAHPFLVGCIILVTLVAAIFWQTSKRPQYQASAQVLVSPVAEESAYTGLPSIVTSSSSDPSRTIQTATSILESPAAAALTASQLGHGATKQQVSSSVSVAPRGESNVISITAKSGSGAQAATVAGTYARAALSLHAKLLSNEAALLIKQLEARTRQLSAAEGSAESAQIGSRLAALSSVAVGRDPNFSLLQLPLPPSAPTGTSKAVMLALALLAGLVIAVGAAVITDYLNRRARDEDEILSVYPLPVLARVPIIPRGARQTGAPGMVPAGVREAFRTLQPQLPQSRSADGRAVMFTSASAGDGKTSAAINFAFVLAAASFRVILIDFDLRRPDVGRRLGVSSDFTELFRSGAQLEDLLKEPAQAPGLQVLSSGSEGAATALVEAVMRQLPELVRRARELADYVIIDTPPLGQISDGLRAAMVVEDIVLVARPGNTSRVELQHTRELLDRMDHTPNGLIVIGEQTVGDAYAVYGLDPEAPVRGAERDLADEPFAPRRSERRGGRRSPIAETHAKVSDGADADRRSTRSPSRGAPRLPT